MIGCIDEVGLLQPELRVCEHRVPLEGAGSSAAKNGWLLPKEEWSQAQEKKSNF